MEYRGGTMVLSIFRIGISPDASVTVKVQSPEHTAYLLLLDLMIVQHVTCFFAYCHPLITIPG